MSHNDDTNDELEKPVSRGINRREFIKITVAGVGAVTATMALGGCGSDSQPAAPTSANFAVMSDLHYYDPTLGTKSADFLEYVAGDRKMIAESQELLNAAVADIMARKPDFVLVPGDLTKDGEKQNHQQVAAKLGELRSKGIKVYVIPGNHDIKNPASYQYPDNATKLKIPNIQPADFKSIYSDCGYGAALAQDPASLSYVAEPVPGLWVIAIDSCKYANNDNLPAPETGGAITDATLAWIKTQLAAAKQQGKTVIGMLHHGLWKHFSLQDTLFAEYLVDDWQTRSKTLSDAGLTVVFTGHFHANDVVRNDFTSSVLHDIETGSLVTAPSPYRFVQFDLVKQAMTIYTSRVSWTTNHLSDFVSFSQNFLYAGLAGDGSGNPGLVPQMLTPLLTAPPAYGGLGLDPTTAGQLVGQITPLISYAMMSHYYGDENGLANASCASQVVLKAPYPPYPLAAYASSAWGTALANPTDPANAYLITVVNGVWIDTAPPDNNVTITPNRAA